MSPPMGLLNMVGNQTHRAYATMLCYVVRTGLFGLATNVNFEHPTFKGGREGL